MTLTHNRQSGTCLSDLHADVPKQNKAYHAAIDALESLVLAHACADIDVEAPAYLEGIETTVDAVVNEYVL
jgi:hypothetical protein